MATAFSPVRLTASSEEAALAQALTMTGASAGEVEVEVLERSEKGVTVRVSPLGSAPRAAAPAPAAPAPVSTPAPAEVPAPALAAPDEEEEIDYDAFPPEPEYLDEEIEKDEDDEVEEISAPAPAGPRLETPPVVDAEQCERARAQAQELLDRMGLVAVAKVVEPAPAPVEEGEKINPQAFLDVEGEDVSILIGKHGQTLQSFQYLLNLTLNNKPSEEEGSALRVVVDAGGYRARRAVSLDQNAQSAASRAKRDRRAIRMDPMPAGDRRLVHIALRGDSEVTTSSEGREPNRYVVVSPKNGSGGPPRGRRPENRGGRGGYGRGR